MILEFASVVLIISFFIVLLAVLMGRRPSVTDFEARQRASRGSQQVGKPPTSLSSRISEGAAMATDLEYLKAKVGGTGSMEGELHVGTDPEPRRVRVRVAGGIPICPLCGMPMERVEALKQEKASDFIFPRESDDRRWKCYHEFPVIFIPDQRPSVASADQKT